MCEDRKKRLQQALTRFKQGFADRPTRALDELLSSYVVCAIVDEEMGFYRERVYLPLTTLGLFIGQALSADGACQDAVARHLSERTALGPSDGMSMRQPGSGGSGRA